MQRPTPAPSAAGDGGYIAVLTRDPGAGDVRPVARSRSTSATGTSSAQNVQRAADAAALAGVTYMPGNLAQAKATRSTTPRPTGSPWASIPSRSPGSRASCASRSPQTDHEHLRPAARPATPRRSSGPPSRTSRRRCRWAARATSSATGRSRCSNAVDPRSSNCAAAGEFWANVGSPQATKSQRRRVPGRRVRSAVDG